MSANDDLGITIPVNRPTNVDELAATIKAQPTPRSAPSVTVQQPAGANPDAPVPFVFGDEIARGGMGSILKADDCKLGRTIAVKIMLSELDADEDQKQRFINEAGVLARLAHPNIVPIYDIGRDSEGQLYYTMKLVKGRTLQAVINDLRGEVPETTRHYTLAHLLTIFRKVCDAMAFAHSQGIIHRDLKPENIMVGEFGEVLVMDWGLAKILGQEDEGGMTKAGRPDVAASSIGSTLEGSVMGTPQYMSPEQAEGRVADMDARSDIFSLGGILYCILTLRPPVEGKTLDEVLQRVISGSITSPSLFGATATKGQPVVKGEVLEAKKITPLPHLPGGRVPAALSAVVMKALCVDKVKRYQNINALSTDIEKYEGGFATGAEQAGAWTQLMLLVKRNKAASIGVAAVLLVGGVLGTKAVIEGRRAQRGEALAQREAARAEREAAAAKATLTDLRRTAPVFYKQAKVDFQDGKLKDAVEKLGYAIQLDETSADYHLLRADLRQSSEHLAEAAEGYRRVLALRPADKSATTNITLCEKLLKESGGAALNRDQKLQLLAALRAQKRVLEAAPLAAELDPDIAAARTAILARLREVRKQAGWVDNRLGALPDGTFKIDFGQTTMADFSVLKGLPVSALAFNEHCPISDLSTMAGLPLRELTVVSGKVSDLSPLRGMPLERLNVSTLRTAVRSLVTDLSPLRGMKLKSLCLANSEISDLSPLAGMPLEELNLWGSARVRDLAPLAQCKHLGKLEIYHSPVSDLGPLAGLPLTEFSCSGPAITSIAVLAGAPLKVLVVGKTSVTDLSPLARSTQLEVLDVMKSPVSDLEPLAKLPLKRIILKDTKVTVLSPLAECITLEEIVLPPGNVKDLPVLRHLPRLKRLSVGIAGGGASTVFDGRFSPGPEHTAEDFWREYDAKQAAGKK